MSRNIASLLPYTINRCVAVSVAEKDEKIRLLQDKCEELEHLENVEIKLQKAEEEIKK